MRRWHAKTLANRHNLINLIDLHAGAGTTGPGRKSKNTGAAPQPAGRPSSPWCRRGPGDGPFPELTLIKNQKGVLFARCGPTAGVSVLSVARYNLINLIDLHAGASKARPYVPLEGVIVRPLPSKK
jgi:hypothetical protein